jgi:hypothetical protein
VAWRRRGLAGRLQSDGLDLAGAQLQQALAGRAEQQTDQFTLS